MTNINIATRTAERVFEQACEKAGTAKRFEQNKKSIIFYNIRGGERW